MKPILTIFTLLVCPYLLLGQKLKPGFDKAEYIELLKISAQVGDSAYVSAFPSPQRSKIAYRSRVIGLENRWDLWIEDQSIAVLSIRGTTVNSVSWLGNFYAAMVPAKGSIQISKTDNFQYELAADPKAAVHVGWLVSTGFLAKDILPKIDSCYKAGIKDVLIMGHSQGGGIAFLLTAYLRNLQKQAKLPADIQIKTYCSAGPKPGNLYFAYEYEAATQNGWAYNVINSSDWVPEVPFSIQTINDVNNTNPFKGAPGMIKKQKLPQRIVMNYIYNSLSKPALKAQRNYQKFLGGLASKSVKKNLPGYVAPEYVNSSDYVRTGTSIILLGDSEYFKKFPDSDTTLFVHHLHPPYLFLTERLSIGSNQMQTTSVNSKLDGNWELNYISGRKIAFEGLYPEKKPFITFDSGNQRVSGSTSCNSFTGKLITDGQQISFTDPMAMTRMMCPGEGEQAFLNVLKTVNRFSISDDNTLTLIMGDIAVMRFARK